MSEPIYDEPEAQTEPTEEDLVIAGLDHEHMQSYMSIKRAVQFTDLAEHLVELAVKQGLTERT